MMIPPAKLKETDLELNSVRITVVYDNNSAVSGLQTAWGFACVVETGKDKILFDAGQEGTVLLDNMRKLNIDCESINLVVISNILHDHMRGLSEFLKQNQQAPVYIPDSCLPSVTDIFPQFAGRFVGVQSTTELCPGIFTLGPFPAYVCEQVLAFRTSNGLVLVSGCGRPGIEVIVKKARTLFPGESIYLALGGFHLGRLNNSDISQTVANFRRHDIQKVAPCHCSGGVARELFKREYKDNYVQTGVGGIVEFGVDEKISKTMLA